MQNSIIKKNEYEHINKHNYLYKLMDSNLYSELSGNAVKLLNYIVKLYNVNMGFAFPSMRHLIDKMGIGRTQIKKYIKELEDIKLIKYTPGSGREGSKFYLLDIPSEKSQVTYIQDAEKVTPYPVKNRHPECRESNPPLYNINNINNNNNNNTSNINTSNSIGENMDTENRRKQINVYQVDYEFEEWIRQMGLDKRYITNLIRFTKLPAKQKDFTDALQSWVSYCIANLEGFKAKLSIHVTNFFRDSSKYEKAKYMQKKKLKEIDAEQEKIEYINTNTSLTSGEIDVW